jgi:hypothetical protein
MPRLRQATFNGEGTRNFVRDEMFFEDIDETKMK